MALMLTPREREVIDLVALGLSNDEVAARLYVERRTVTTHLTHIYAATGTRNRTELTRMVLLDRIHRLEHENAVLRGKTLDQVDLRNLAHYAANVSLALEPICNGDK